MCNIRFTGVMIGMIGLYRADTGQRGATVTRHDGTAPSAIS